MPLLTGTEEWVVAGQRGETVWARRYGAKDWWWPINDVELDCGIFRIDVCGLLEVWALDECPELRINNDRIIPAEHFYDFPHDHPPAPPERKETKEETT